MREILFIWIGVIIILFVTLILIVIRDSTQTQKTLEDVKIDCVQVATNTRDYDAIDKCLEISK